jgi:hypothetical protein
MSVTAATDSAFQNLRSRLNVTLCDFDLIFAFPILSRFRTMLP